MFTEDELLPISALQHFLFCERQCALIHLEQLWAENRFTVEGQHLHKKAHSAGTEKRPGVTTTRGLMLRSFRLGLFGKADIVEFKQGLVTPVEYKRGKPKANDADRVQLCAQALCLEEMLDVQVPAGALFYGQRRRRTEVLFDEKLRGTTADVAASVHRMIASRKTPTARREPKCDHCSLFNLCMPGTMTVVKSMAGLVERAFKQHLNAAGPTTDAAVPTP